MGMVGLRDVFVVAPAASFHHTQHHHHLHHHHHDGGGASSAALLASAEHPMIPLLTAAPCVVDPDTHGAKPSPSGGTSIQFWQAQPHSHASAQTQQQNPNPNANLSQGGPATISYLKKPVPMLESHGGILGSGGLSGTATCQDCGNQAKKDCSHRRCRTCCKSRGFVCTTHVKSTWVPAARRRERQQVGAAAAGSSASTSATKKPRLLSSQTTTTSHTSTSNTPPRSFDTSSSHQDAGFRDSLPRHVRAPAVFKCVRVTSIDDGEDEYAYQAMVTIGGHVFKGFLYDQGTDDGTSHEMAGTSTSNEENNPNAPIPNISELHLGGVGAAGRDVASSSPLLSSEVYGGSAPTGGGGFLGGVSFANPMN
ncbi:Lateral root primordium (LRP) protein-like protein [Rhynchospora pubera]|uniref:Lateral root primordium (LRP) protein-like protein n=1 Tax=Rhynchospora pubera TaxID=906938 RepID=A0AAV8EL21_9POAL|nr:Lateral root primordium (LRP) protein-like protein [Rhynchospora pubera]